VVEIMLGDTMPWFFPMLALLLTLWIVIASIEKKPSGVEGRSGHLPSLLLRWTPPFMLAWLFLHRAVAILLADSSHMEVIQSLPESASWLERITLLLGGQGGIEIAAFAAATFAVCSHRLPAVKALGDDAAVAVRHRMMMYCALCLLLAARVLFPEQAYTASNPLPQQTTAGLPTLSHAMLPMLFALMVMFGGELFAASSIYSLDVDLANLAQKASIKCFVLIIVCLAWIATGPEAWRAWVDDPTSPTNIVVVLMVLHATVMLSLVLQPSRKIESRLLHGEQRSFALIATFACVAALMVVSVCSLLQTSPVFSKPAGANLYGFWLSTAVIGSMLLVQFMPALGFDAAPRPETWWLRAMGVFTPMIVMAMTPLGVYLLPGVWLGLAWTMVVPWMVESDVRSPSLGFIIAPMGVTTLAALTLPLLSGSVLLAAICFAFPPVCIATIGLLMHKPLAVNETS